MSDQPRQMGKYGILAEVGRGAFATVYRALDPTLNRPVALKVLHPQLLTDPAFVARFQREAQALAGLRHPHIVTVYEVGEAQGRLFIAMELGRGPSLAARLAEQGALSWTEALALLEPVCEALDYAHGQGVVHRDLKPANILLDAERGPLLTDFGFARLVGESSASLSLSGGIVGTAAYIAPEVWELDVAGGPADIYALGCIACEMLTGAVLFTGHSPMQIMRAHDRGPEFPDQWPEGVPAGIDAVLSRALARDPAGRYPSAGAFGRALVELAGQSQAAREADERAALAAQWRAEAEAAMAEGQWNAARMAVARWLALAPGDPLAQSARAAVERGLAGASSPFPPREGGQGDRSAQELLSAGALLPAHCRARRIAKWGEWTAVTMATWVAALLLFNWLLSVANYGWYAGGRTWVLWMVVGILEGTCSGWGQSLLLRGKLRNAHLWVLAMALGGAVAGACVALTGSLGAWGWVLAGAAGGALAALSMWPLLRDRVRFPLWVVLTTLGWGAAWVLGCTSVWILSGLLVGVATGLPLLPVLAPAAHDGPAQPASAGQRRLPPVALILIVLFAVILLILFLILTGPRVQDIFGVVYNPRATKPPAIP